MARINLKLCMGFCLGALALSCGNEPEGYGAPDDVLSTTTEAVEAAADHPPQAGAIQVGADNLWIFNCSASSDLRLKKKAQAGWSTWASLSNICDGGIAVSIFNYPDGRQEIGAYTRSPDGHLWETWHVCFPDGSCSVFQGDITVDWGIGEILGSPRMVGYGNDGDNAWLDIVVQTAPEGSVKVVHWDQESGFVASKVYTTPTNHTAIKTKNSLSTAPHNWMGNEFQFEHGLISGRGGITSGTDDTTLWTALYFGDRWNVTETWTGTDGNPTFSILIDGFHRGFELARVGSGLRDKRMGASGTWTSLTGCDVAGSPQVDTRNQETAYIRGTNGNLVKVFPDVAGGGSCTTLSSSAGALTSAPLPFTYLGSSDNVLFKGTNGKLWVKLNGSSALDLGLSTR